ncbi:MAG: transporter, partial [Opitutaceae bacterium]
MKLFRNSHPGLLLLGFLTLVRLSAAAEAAAPAASLEALVAEIVARNPEVRFYEAEIDAAKAGRRSAGTLNDPEVAVQGGRKRVRDPGGVLSGEGTAWS